MAMIQCPECGKDISTDAKSCPHCGCLVRKRLQQQEREKNRTEKEKIRAAAAKPSGGKPGNKKIPILAAVAAVVVAVVLLVVLVVLPSTRKNSEFRKIGNLVTFGHYEQDADESNGPEPIEWIVLDVQDGKALLLSKYGLDTKPYNTKFVGVTWETCTMRAWLNGAFLNAAFAEKEKSSILLTEVDNSKAQGFDWTTVGAPVSADGGNNTQDKIFLLSWAEAEKYLETAVWDSDNPDKVYPKAQAAPTEYAIRNGAYKSNSNKTAEGDAAGWWWLRSPGGHKSCAADVDSDGSLDDHYVDDVDGCVRPAFWLNLESDL